MLFVISALDKAGAGELRLATRPAHIEYVKQSGAIRLAGPYLDDDGAMIGSLIVLDAPDLAAAKTWAANDPYQRAGLFQSSLVVAWKASVNFCGADLS